MVSSSFCLYHWIVFNFEYTQILFCLFFAVLVVLLYEMHNCLVNNFYLFIYFNITEPLQIYK